MFFFELIVLGVALSIDAMSVAIGVGLCGGPLSRRDEWRLGLFFGGFQAAMPAIGYLLGQQLRPYVQPLDHWITFALLLYIAISMTREAFEDRRAVCDSSAARDKLKTPNLLLLSLATSIDALAAGISLALTPNYPIVTAILLIGSITFTLSVLGAHFGGKLGSRFRFASQLCGAAVLFAIGLKTLIEHLLARI